MTPGGHSEEDAHREAGTSPALRRLRFFDLHSIIRCPAGPGYTTARQTTPRALGFHRPAYGKVHSGDPRIRKITDPAGRKDLQLDAVPPLVKELAHAGLWIEQETIALDERLCGALEAWLLPARRTVSERAKAT